MFFPWISSIKDKFIGGSKKEILGNDSDNS